MSAIGQLVGGGVCTPPGGADSDDGECPERDGLTAERDSKTSPWTPVECVSTGKCAEAGHGGLLVCCSLRRGRRLTLPVGVRPVEGQEAAAADVDPDEELPADELLLEEPEPLDDVLSDDLLSDDLLSDDLVSDDLLSDEDDEDDELSEDELSEEDDSDDDPAGVVVDELEPRASFA